MKSATSPRRPATGLHFRPRLETFEDRTVPAAFFQGYGPDPNPNRYQGLVIEKGLTPVDTNNDPSAYEAVTFSFRDTDPDRETMYLLVYRKTDDSLPPNIVKSEQVLISFDTQTTSGNPADGKTYTMTVKLPACAYQVDATVAPAGFVDPGSPIFYETANNHNLDAALGRNPCLNPQPLTQGYWKNHFEKWNFDSMTLGKTLYSKEQLLDLLNTPVKGNAAVAMAHQLIAAKLNLAAGVSPSDAAMDAINAADMMLAMNDGFYLRPNDKSDFTRTTFSLSPSYTMPALPPGFTLPPSYVLSGVNPTVSFLNNQLDLFNNKKL